ncbi:hypothetical protein ONS96_001076 [Cadophora gregata f. sp. sojae]|nr:hypothetical protein ONS96_001076 [Cadophora gregata f. sp. sojae]
MQLTIGIMKGRREQTNTELKKDSKNRNRRLYSFQIVQKFRSGHTYRDSCQGILKLRRSSCCEDRFQEEGSRDVATTPEKQHRTRRRENRIAALVASVMAAGRRRFMNVLGSNRIPTFDVAPHATLTFS